MMSNCSGAGCSNNAPSSNTQMNQGTNQNRKQTTVQNRTYSTENLINPVIPPYPNQVEYTEIDNLPYYNKTNYLPSVPGTTNVPVGTVANTAANVGTVTPGMPAGSLPSQDDVFQDSPLFEVPNNPILPPGYQNILDYNTLQYMNGFLRTQIGKYLRVQQLIGSSVIEDRYGYLVGVGINYILLQEISTGNILVLDFYNIKFIYLYYTKTDLPQNEIR